MRCNLPFRCAQAGTVQGWFVDQTTAVFFAAGKETFTFNLRPSFPKESTVTMKLHVSWLIPFATFAVTNVAIADELATACLAQYKVLENQFQLYNEKSALANGIMDGISSYAKAEVDITAIKVQDARAWRSALEVSVTVGQLMLQNTIEYGVTCSSGPEQKKQSDEIIRKLNVDLRVARARTNALATGFPASPFR
jgi:hypothetical protein